MIREYIWDYFFVRGMEAGAMPLLFGRLGELRGMTNCQNCWKIALNLNLRHWQQLGRTLLGYFSWGEMFQVYF